MGGLVSGSAGFDETTPWMNAAHASSIEATCAVVIPGTATVAVAAFDARGRASRKSKRSITSVPLCHAAVPYDQGTTKEPFGMSQNDGVPPKSPYHQAPGATSTLI